MEVVIFPVFFLNMADFKKRQQLQIIFRAGINQTLFVPVLEWNEKKKW